MAERVLVVICIITLLAVYTVAELKCSYNVFDKTCNAILNQTVIEERRVAIENCLMESRNTTLRVTNYTCDEYICALNCNGQEANLTDVCNNIIPDALDVFFTTLIIADWARPYAAVYDKECEVDAKVKEIKDLQDNLYTCSSYILHYVLCFYDKMHSLYKRGP